SLPRPLRPLLSTLFPYTTLFRSAALEIHLQHLVEDRILDRSVQQIVDTFRRDSLLVDVDFYTENAPADQIAVFLETTLNGSDRIDRKSTRLNSSHEWISYAVFCL